MTVRSDSKGRVSIGPQGESYHKNVDPSGRIVLTPVVPRTVNNTREVTQEEFEKFFGVPAKSIRVDGVHTFRVTNDPGEYLPHGIIVETFILDESGERVVSDGELVSENTLIKIRKNV